MIPALLGLLSPIIGKIIDRIPDPVAREKARLEAEASLREQENRLLEIVAASDKAQTDINLEEAKSIDPFTSRWRPAAGWVAVVSLALYFWPRYLLGMFFWCKVAWLSQTLPALPDMGIADIMGLLGSLLGMGSMRMIEKIKGVASK